ncbi:MAG: hypothetical protein P8Y29_09790 [Gemmatimonadota bacterium]
MSRRRDPEVVFRELCAAARGRRHQRQSWTSAAVAAAFVFALLAWEIVVGPAGVFRWLGYLAVTIVALVAGWRLVRDWRQPGLEAGDIVAELGRLFPQTRGTLAVGNRAVAMAGFGNGGVGGVNGDQPTDCCQQARRSFATPTAGVAVADGRMDGCSGRRRCRVW